MVRTEASSEEVYNQRKQEPPGSGTGKESHNDKQARQHRGDIVARGVRVHIEHCKEGEQIWYHRNEVGHRKAEHRDKIAPR